MTSEDEAPPPIAFAELPHLALARSSGRVEASASESDLALLYELLLVGELILKLVTAAAVASVSEDLDRTRYGFEYRLLRATGIGEWSQVLSQVVTGPAYQLLRPAARPAVSELTGNFSAGAPGASWQRDALEALNEACQLIDPELERVPARASLRWWFTAFTALRNRTRGHGAPTGPKASAAIGPLGDSIRLVAANLTFLSQPWMHLHQNLTGKFRVTAICGDCKPFDYLKSEVHHRHETGCVYIGFSGELCRTPLITSDTEMSDVWVANGNFKQDGTAEFLSLVTDERKRVDCSSWMVPPEALPVSETHGNPELTIVGQTFTNIPPALDDYVARPELETRLMGLLTNDRHPVITLVGRGGIGKTSLAIEALHRIAENGQYLSILWFSARDIDLMPYGPKSVRADVLTKEDVANSYATLVEPPGSAEKGFVPLDAWTRALADRQSGAATLFVFDNFETLADPVELYQYVDNYIRLPNKVLITTRMRDFKADYPLEVRGMTRGQFDSLVGAAAQKLEIQGLLTPSYVDSLFDESDGHPYIAKVLLGEVARSGVATKAARILGQQDDALRALFERTYGLLSPAAQRVFLTLCNWKSMVPVVALEAALLRPRNERMDVAGALDELLRSSLVETVTSADGTEFVRVPLSGALFGLAKLRVSPSKPAVELDTQLLQRLGPTRPSELDLGLAPRAQRLVRSLASDRQSGVDVADEISVLKYLANAYPPVLLDLAEMYQEGNDPDFASAIDVLELFLQQQPDDPTGWRQIARVARRAGDADRELNALLRLAELADADYSDVSDAASGLARLRKDLALDRETREAAEERLIHLMESRIDEASGLDLSRLAWLHLFRGHTAEAAEVVRTGLSMDPDNRHLLKLSASPDLVGHH